MGKMLEFDDAQTGKALQFDNSQQPAFTPKKIGAEAFADNLREVLAGTDWGPRNLAGAGSALVSGLEGLGIGSQFVNALNATSNALTGGSLPTNTNRNSNIAAQKVIAEEAPIGNIAGNVAMLAPTAFIPGANTVAGAGTIGALQGALLTPGDMAERAKAAAFGAGGGALGAGLSKAMQATKPITANKNVAALTAEGIGVTPGQNAGGALRILEDKLTSMPWVGDIINNSRRRGIEDFNKAAFNRVLKPLGKSTDEVGREGFAGVKQSIGSSYDEVLSKLNNISADSQFVDDLANLREMVKMTGKQDQFDQILEQSMLRKFTDAGRMSGETMKDVESALGQQSLNYRKALDPDQRGLGDALREAQNVLRQTVQRSNPANADELQEINKAYANYARIRKAAGMSGTAKNEGVFTPAQLNSAVQLLDQSAGKGSYASGGALLQDLTDPAMAVLPSIVPDSGTAGRSFANAFTPTGFMANAAGAVATLPAFLAYSRPGQAAINATVNKGIKPATESIRSLLAGNPDLARLLGMSGTKLVGN